MQKPTTNPSPPPPPPSPPDGEDEPPPPPPPQPTEGFWVKEQRVYKCGLRQLLRTPALEQQICSKVEYVTKLSFAASRPLQFHIQRVIGRQLPFPNVRNQTWIRQVFMVLVGNIDRATLRDPDLITSYRDHFQPEIGHQLLIPSPRTAQVVTYAGSQYTDNISAYIETHFELMSRRWAQQCLQIRGLPQRQARIMATLIWEHAMNGILETGDDAETEEWAQVEEIVGQEHNDVEELDPVFYPYVERIRSHAVNNQTKMILMYEFNALFTSWSAKVYSLVPLCSWTAKYIILDTDALYYMLGGHNNVKFDRQEFAHRQQEYWQTHFKITDRLFPAENDHGNRMFGFMLNTDGVGASVHIFRWKRVWRYNETPERRKERLQQARNAREQTVFARIRNRAEQVDLTWIGVDPGRRSLITAATIDGPRWTYEMTSAVSSFHQSQ